MILCLKINNLNKIDEEVRVLRDRQNLLIYGKTHSQLIKMGRGLTN